MTRILMSASALILVLLGIPCVFALYCGFAEIDWMGRGNGNPLRQPASS